MSSNQNKSSNKQKYNLASALSRISTRFLDLLVVILFATGLFFAIFKDEKIDTFPMWKFALITMIFGSLLLIYFIFVPFLSGGYTIFSKMFKIRIYSVNLKILTSRKRLKHLDFMFLSQLILRESITIVSYAIIFILLGILSLTTPELTREYIKNILNTEQIANSVNPIAIIFNSLFSVLMIVNSLIILNVIFFSRKRTFTDHISNTVVIKMVDVSGSDEPEVHLHYKNKKNKIKYNLPGEINIDDVIGDE